MTDNFGLDPDNIPRHIAIIMDGNGRWAKLRGKLRVVGHKAGADTVKKIIRAADDLGVEILTLYAFSTENWKRSRIEVRALMALLRSFLRRELHELMDKNVKLYCIGQKEKLPPEVREVLDHSIDATSRNTGMILNLALSYGGRSEIIMAVKSLAKKCADGKLAYEEITEEMLSSHLYTAGLCDPDMLIRTGGEYRLSNFLLWQVSYAELYITDILWPDFDRDALIEAVLNFQNRQRRFGRTGDQVVRTG
ncbi:MAG: isoprenyl transferase [Desulfobulbaceae bacterium]|nr:isoprenyl transferase [Desulfobulbaceae bacterium]MCK5543942.1 isoprenyl transferase [Desulfobulbaceae bacterium]